MILSTLVLWKQKKRGLRSNANPLFYSHISNNDNIISSYKTHDTAS